MGAELRKMKKYEPPKILNFHQNRQRYNKDHKLFEERLVDGNISEQITKQLKFNEINEKRIGNLYDDLGKGKKDLIDGALLICEKFVERIMSQYFIEKDFHIFEWAEKIYNKFDLTESEMEQIESIKQRFQQEFEDTLSYSFLNFRKQYFNGMNDKHFMSFLNNINYNEKYQPNILTIYMNDGFGFEPITKNIDRLYETIANAENLQIVNIILAPLQFESNKWVEAESYNLINEYYVYLYKIIEGVSKNRNIKGFSLHSRKDFNIILPPEITNLILKKLQSETLIFFHLGNFKYSSLFEEKLSFLLSSTKSLLFLSLEDSKYSKRDENVKLKESLEKNSSVIVLSVVSPYIKKRKEKFKKDLVNGTLKVIHVSEESIYTVPDPLP